MLKFNRPSGLIRFSVGLNARHNVRLDRQHLFNIGMLNEEGRLSFKLNETEKTIFIRKALSGDAPSATITPLGANGKALQPGANELSYYPSATHLGSHLFAGLNTVDITPVPWAQVKGGVLLDLSAVIKWAQNPKQLNLLEGLTSGPVFLKDATLDQIADRLRELSEEAV